MSRGGRGGWGGRGGGRSGFPGGMPPAGLTFADLQNLSREASELYPPLEPLPLLTEYTEEERTIARLQTDFAMRLKKSKYYVVNTTKNTDLPRYSDKYRPLASSRPQLRKQDLHAPFFPQGLFEDYFDPKKKKKSGKKSAKKVDLDKFGSDAEEEESNEGSQAGSEAEASDYDVEEEYDNDYAENYFDNGEGDDDDALGPGAGGDDGGGDYE